MPCHSPKGERGPEIVGTQSCVVMIIRGPTLVPWVVSAHGRGGLMGGISQVLLSSNTTCSCASNLILGGNARH